MTDTDTRYRSPGEVSTQLEISPSTLRRWSNEFADFLSDAAGRPEPSPGSHVAHRRYTDEDLETLMTIKGLLTEGLTYIQVGKRLEALRLRKRVAESEGHTDVEAEGDETQVTAVVTGASPYAPAAAVLADTMHTVADGQQLLLGSQKANRDLLSVVLQDNFGLKEENAKLRDRMLDLERDLSEMRRQDASRREALETRLRELESQARQQTPQAKHAAQTERPGCLGQFFG
ncbi:MAG: MerR family transcriptional regulator [Anaerolineae bacterium]|jgi:DNA-binding transcriptional MerR regulator